MFSSNLSVEEHIKEPKFNYYLPCDVFSKFVINYPATVSSLDLNGLFALGLFCCSLITPYLPPPLHTHRIVPTLTSLSPNSPLIKWFPCRNWITFCIPDRKSLIYHVVTPPITLTETKTVFECLHSIVFVLKICRRFFTSSLGLWMLLLSAPHQGLH